MLSRLRRLFGCSAYKQAEPPAAKESQKVFHAAHGVLKDKLDALLANDQSGLCQEYNSLTDCNILETSDTAEHAQNASKNRYVNVLPFDFNRVKISGEDDYINASLIQSEPEEAPCWSYIAAQGPLASTVVDFWKMVFENNCKVLIMLTRTVENNHIKCADYFNQQPGETAKHGTYRVTTTDVVEVSEDITKRTLQLKNYKTQEVHQITHYHYHRWPDFGVPESTLPIRQLVRLLWEGGHHSFTVVHCSAGIGRTGTLMAIDIMLRRLWSMVDSNSVPTDSQIKAAVDLPSVVHCLRKQRRGMVQTLEQYYFCYEAVLHELEQSCGSG